jgi:hypothetical protein
MKLRSMKNRLRDVGIAIRYGNLQRPRWAVAIVGAMTVVLSWMVAVTLAPGPEDPLTNVLSWLAAACGFLTLLGQLPGVLSLRSRYPILVIVGGVLCLALSVFCFVRQPTGALLLRLGLPLFLAGLNWYYIFVLSVFRGKYRVSRLQVGDRFPDFCLPDSENRPVTLAAMLAGGPVLMVFYKGDW